MNDKEGMEQGIAASTELISRLLAMTKSKGATEAEVVVSADSGLSVTSRNAEVETIEFNKDRGLAVTVYFGKRKGSASSGDLSDNAIEKCVEKACDIARYTQEDPFHGLADASLMATEFPDLDLYHPWDLEVDEAIELAIACEDAGLTHSSAISNSEGATVHCHDGHALYANSHGFIGVSQGSRHSISCALIAGKDDAMQTAYWYSLARDRRKLDPAREIGQTAAKMAVARLNARQVKTCQVPVLYAADMARSLLSHLVGAISGGSQYRKVSFLLDAAGEKLFPDFVQIHERPRLVGGLGSGAFDAEGVATSARHIVESGVLTGYVLSSYSARKLGLQTTANSGGVHNLTADPGDKGQAELIAEMDRGFFVTELMGQGVDISTGDYSRGAAGFWVENGEIQFPVQGVTVASNLRDMFRGIVAIGNDIDHRSATSTGSILIDKMTVAGL